MTYYQIQSLDDLKQVYADVQVVHVASDDVNTNNPNRSQQIVLDDSQQILLQNDAQQQVVYQAPQQQQYQPPSAGAHYTILGEDITQQQHQVMLQQQQQQQQVLDQHQQQTHQIPNYQLQSDAQHLQVTAEHQMQHVQSQAQQPQQIYYTTDQMVQPSAIVQHGSHNQQQQQQQKKVYIQQQTQTLQQHYQQSPQQTHQMMHQAQASPQHILHGSQHQQQQIQMQHQVSPSTQQSQQQQQIIYRMQTQQPTAQLQQQAQLIGNTHVIVQQPSGQQVLIQQPQQQEIIMRQSMNQRILYNNRVLYSTPQQSQQQQPHQQQQPLLHQTTQHQQQHIQLHATSMHHAQTHLIQTRVNQQPQSQQPQPSAQQPQAQAQQLQQNVIYHQIQVQNNQLSKSLHTSPQMNTSVPVPQQLQQPQTSLLPIGNSATLVRTSFNTNNVRGSKTMRGTSVASMGTRIGSVSGASRTEIRLPFAATSSSGQSKGGGPVNSCQTPRSSRSRNGSTSTISTRGRGSRNGKGTVQGVPNRTSIGNNQIAGNVATTQLNNVHLTGQNRVPTQGISNQSIRQIYRTTIIDESNNVQQQTQQQEQDTQLSLVQPAMQSQSHLLQSPAHSQPMPQTQLQQQGRILPGTIRFKSPIITANQHNSHLIQNQPQPQPPLPPQLQNQLQNIVTPNSTITSNATTTATATATATAAATVAAVAAAAAAAAEANNSGASNNFDLDLEDSIQAVFVKKDAQKNAQPGISGNMDSTTLTTYYTAKDDVDHRVIKSQNGACMTLAEYKKRNAGTQSMPNAAVLKILNQTTSGTKIPLPVTSGSSMCSNRGTSQKHQIQSGVEQLTQVAAAQNANLTAGSSVHQTAHNNYEIQTQHVLQNRIGQQVFEKDRNSAKMLVILVSGEQRLITFTLPRESCTVQDLLEQVGVPFDSTTTIQCVENPGANIDFVVTVGFSVQESASELISRAELSLQFSRQQETLAQLAGQVSSNANNNQQANTGDSNPNSSPRSMEHEDSVKDISTSNIKPTLSLKSEDLVQRKLIFGYYAICQSCGFSGYDHAKCERCKRVFLEPPKKVPVKQDSVVTSSNSDKRRSIELTPQRGKGSQNISTPNSISIRGRSGSQALRGRGARCGRRLTEIEPVILTLSSDDEEEPPSTFSSMTSNIGLKTHLSTLMANKPLPFDLNLPEMDENTIYEDFKRDSVIEINDYKDAFAISPQCNLVRIGMYSFKPSEPVVITSKGIQIVAPKECNANEYVTLNIYNIEVTFTFSFLSNDAESMLVFFITQKCAQYIKNNLKMCDNMQNYGAFTAIKETHQSRRIVLHLVRVTDYEKTCIETVFNRMEKITFADVQRMVQVSKEIDQITEQLKISDKKKKDNVSSNNAEMCTDLSDDIEVNIKNDNRNDSNMSKTDTRKKTIQLKATDVRQLLIYPHGKGGIPINTEDYMCLASDQYLNDIIIDFYLKWLHSNVVPECNRDRTFIFSSFFYKRLTTMQRNVFNPDKEVKMNAAQKRHVRVQNWTKNQNLFQKDFIIIPINEHSHWFLAIICFPGLKGPVTFDTNKPVELQSLRKTSKLYMQIGSTTITTYSNRPTVSCPVLTDVCGIDDESERDEAEGDESDMASDSNLSDLENSNSMNVVGNSSNTNSNLDRPSSGMGAIITSNPQQQEPIKQPLILIFDSLAGASRSRVVATLRDYLSCEYKAKMPTAPTHIFNKDNMPGHCVKVPQQNNFTDCGLYLLQYVEKFFTNPIRDYRIPIKQLSNWFETLSVTKKREDISKLLQKLMDENNGPNNRILLPEIPFPTVNGQLVESEALKYDYDEDDFEEDEDVFPFRTLLTAEEKIKTLSNSKESSNNQASTLLIHTNQYRSVALKRRLPMESDTDDNITANDNTNINVNTDDDSTNPGDKITNSVDTNDFSIVKTSINSNGESSDEDDKMTSPVGTSASSNSAGNIIAVGSPAKLRKFD